MQEHWNAEGTKAWQSADNNDIGDFVVSVVIWNL